MLSTEYRYLRVAPQCINPRTISSLATLKRLVAETFRIPGTFTERALAHCL